MITVRWSLAGRPVEDFCGGSSGRSRSHCASVKSLGFMTRSVGRREICRHALVLPGPGGGPPGRTPGGAARSPRTPRPPYPDHHSRRPSRARKAVRWRCTRCTRPTSVSSRTGCAPACPTTGTRSTRSHSASARRGPPLPPPVPERPRQSTGSRRGRAEPSTHPTLWPPRRSSPGSLAVIAAAAGDGVAAGVAEQAIGEIAAEQGIAASVAVEHVRLGGAAGDPVGAGTADHLASLRRARQREGDEHGGQQEAIAGQVEGKRHE